MTNELRSRTTTLGAMALTILAVFQAVLGHHLMAASMIVLILPLLWRQRLLGDARPAPSFRQLISQRSHAATAAHLSLAAALIGIAFIASISLWLLAHAIVWGGTVTLLWLSSLLHIYLQKASN